MFLDHILNIEMLSNVLQKHAKDYRAYYLVKHLNENMRRKDWLEKKGLKLDRYLQP